MKSKKTKVEHSDAQSATRVPEANVGAKTTTLPETTNTAKKEREFYTPEHKIDLFDKDMRETRKNALFTGRPRRAFMRKWCAMLYVHMAEGFSFESFGGVIVASTETLYTWLAEEADFAKAKNIGEAAARLWWENEGMLAARMGKDYNAAIWIFNMKNRFGWRDMHEVTGKDGKPLVQNPFSAFAELILNQPETMKNLAQILMSNNIVSSVAEHRDARMLVEESTTKKSNGNGKNGKNGKNGHNVAH